MKNTIFRLCISAFIFISFFGCEEIGLKKDPCDDSILKTEYRFNATSNLVVGKIIMNSAKAHELQYNITYTKIRCGGKTTTYYSTPMYTQNANIVSYEFEQIVNCSTEFRNTEDEIIVELTVHLRNESGGILETKTATDLYTYNDLNHSVSNGSVNIVPVLNISF